jgi:hypothetical protein
MKVLISAAMIFFATCATAQEAQVAATFPSVPGTASLETCRQAANQGTVVGHDGDSVLIFFDTSLFRISFSPEIMTCEAWRYIMPQD